MITNWVFEKKNENKINVCFSSGALINYPKKKDVYQKSCTTNKKQTSEKKVAWHSNALLRICLIRTK